MFRHECSSKTMSECVCGESSIAKLEWNLGPIEENNQEPGYVWRGTQTLRPNRHHFWEYRVLKTYSPRSSVIGIGCAQVGVCSKLLHDNRSDKVNIIIGSRMIRLEVFIGSGTIVGFHLDRVRAKLNLYVDREKMFEDSLDISSSIPVVPIVQSSGDENHIRLICSQSFEDSLSFLSSKTLSHFWGPRLWKTSRNPNEAAFRVCELLPPGLITEIDSHFWFLFGTRLKVSEHKIRRAHEEFDVAEDSDESLPYAVCATSKKCSEVKPTKCRRIRPRNEDSSDNSDNAVLFFKNKHRKITRHKRRPRKSKSKNL